MFYEGGGVKKAGFRGIGAPQAPKKACGAKIINCWSNFIDFQWLLNNLMTCNPEYDKEKHRINSEAHENACSVAKECS